MAVTIRQIAEAVGISRGTVDRALNNRGRINPELAEKIRQVADELGYVPRPRKKAGTGKGNLKIGIVTQLASASFMLEINRGINDAREELKDWGVEVSVKSIDSVDEAEQRQAIDELVQEGIHGLAIMPIDCEQIRARLSQLINEKNIPVVTFNSDIVGTGRCCFVGMDNRRSGYTAAGLLGTLTGGCGKVLVITGYFSSLLNNLRVDGFVEELKRCYPGLEIAGVQSSFNEMEEVERIIRSAFLNVSGINGILVVSGGQEGISRAFDRLKLEKRPYVVIYDQTPKNEKLLQENFADFLIDQNGYVQGYRPPYILMNLLKKGILPEAEFQYTDIIIKTKYNL